MQFFRAQRGDDDERPLGVSSGELEQVDYGIDVLLLLFDDDIAKKLLELIGEQKKIDPAGAETASQRRKPLINCLEGCQERVETIERESAFRFQNLIESLADLEVINFSNGRVLETDFRKSLRSLLQREQRLTHVVPKRLDDLLARAVTWAKGCCIPAARPPRNSPDIVEARQNSGKHER